LTRNIGAKLIAEYPFDRINQLLLQGEQMKSHEFDFRSEEEMKDLMMKGLSGNNSRPYIRGKILAYNIDTDGKKSVVLPGIRRLRERSKETCLSHIFPSGPSGSFIGRDWYCS
jgi:hypothetical protein